MSTNYVYIVYYGEIDGENGTWYLTAAQQWTKNINKAYRYHRSMAIVLARNVNGSIIDAYV